MADAEQLRQAVERALAEVVAQHLPAMRDAIVYRVLGELGGTVPQQTATELLNSAVTRIQETVAQPEILGAMLDGVAGFSGRAALFVVRGAAAQGWQARGLLQNEAIKTIGLDLTSGLAERAMQTRAPAAGEAAAFEPRFRTAFGEPASAQVVVMPIVVRDKVAGLVYADSGVQADGRLDPAAVELLVRVAANWLELAPVRKAAKVSAEAPAEQAAAVAAEAAPEAPAETAPGVEAPAPEPAMAPEQEEVHRKAKRFAKLLVEEIKLYNQQKVAQGRQKSDLYGILRDDIEKSRASYDKRYGETPAASADYFTQELIRILAEGNVALLGGSFSR